MKNLPSCADVLHKTVNFSWPFHVVWPCTAKKCTKNTRHLQGLCFPQMGLFTWREGDPNARKILEGGTTFRLLYMQKFRQKRLPSGEGKEE